MTTKESVALRLAIIDVRLTLGVLERGQKQAVELGAGHDELTKLAIECGSYKAAVDMAAKDLRDMLVKLGERFPNEAAR